MMASGSHANAAKRPILQWSPVLKFAAGKGPGAGRPDYKAVEAQRRLSGTSAARPFQFAFCAGMARREAAQAGHTVTAADGLLRDAARRTRRRACTFPLTAGMAADPSKDTNHAA